MTNVATITMTPETLKNLDKMSKKLRSQVGSFDSAEGSAEDRAAAFDKIVQLLSVDVKVAKKLTKHMTYEQMLALSEMSLTELEEKATSCCIEMKKVREEVEANEAYQEARETKKTFDSQVRETCAPTKNTLDVCVMLAEQKRRTAQED